MNNNQAIQLKSFLSRQSIQNIYLVNDIGCNFLVDTILQIIEFGLHSQNVLKELSHRILLDTNMSMGQK